MSKLGVVQRYATFASLLLVLFSGVSVVLSKSLPVLWVAVMQFRADEQHMPATTDRGWLLVGFVSNSVAGWIKASSSCWVLASFAAVLHTAQCRVLSNQQSLLKAAPNNPPNVARRGAAVLLHAFDVWFVLYLVSCC